jgi:D-alanine-D-alanine ligase
MTTTPDDHPTTTSTTTTPPAEAPAAPPPPTKRRRKRKAVQPARKLRVLVLMDEGLTPPESLEGLSDDRIAKIGTEFDVCSTLGKLGHEIYKLELREDTGVIRQVRDEFGPDLCFNIIEGFRGLHTFDQHVVSYLELLHLPYTGCNPRGLTLARDKALTKKIMAYHRIRVPAFAVFPRGRRVVRPKKLSFPLIVKSVNVEGSVGISQASVVYDDEKLAERVQYIHEALQTYAIAEQYIEGREIYMGVMGNLKLRTFPAWELFFDNADAENSKLLRIATDKAKFDRNYQDRWGITTREAEDLPEPVERELPHLCKRIYRLLGLTGYARLDFRLTPAGELYLLEANPNPTIGEDEDFALSAAAAGVPYPVLIQQILNLGLSYSPRALC